MRISLLLNPAEKDSHEHQKAVVVPSVNMELVSKPLAEDSESEFSTTSDDSSSAKRPNSTPASTTTLDGVDYPPFVNHDKTTQAELAKLDIVSLAERVWTAKFVPYSSTKMDFSAKTRREGLWVYQYDFKKPGDAGGARTVMWDYETGYVRITPFFKCLGYPKIMPGKIIKDMNPGLKDICCHINGGAIPAQGYWVPFEAAKALLKTFCWEIRYALVPLFGPTIVGECLHPDDPAFTRFTIDERVIKSCANRLKNLALADATPAPAPTIPTPKTTRPKRSTRRNRPITRVSATPPPTAKTDSISPHTSPYASVRSPSPYRGFTPLNGLATPQSDPQLSTRSSPAVQYSGIKKRKPDTYNVREYRAAQAMLEMSRSNQRHEQ